MNSTSNKYQIPTIRLGFFFTTIKSSPTVPHGHYCPADEIVERFNRQLHQDELTAIAELARERSPVNGRILPESALQQSGVVEFG